MGHSTEDRITKKKHFLIRLDAIPDHLKTIFIIINIIIFINIIIYIKQFYQ